jgi:hypothetical protein
MLQNEFGGKRAGFGPPIASSKGSHIYHHLASRRAASVSGPNQVSEAALPQQLELAAHTYHALILERNSQSKHFSQVPPSARSDSLRSLTDGKKAA